MPVPIVYQNFIPPAIDAGNLNTVNNVVYTVIGDGTNAPLNGANVRTNIGALAIAGGIASNLTINTAVINGGTATLSTPLALASGGTNAATAAGAVTNLGLDSVGFRAHNNGVTQNMTTGVFNLLSMSTEVFDSGNFFAANAWTPPAGRLVTISGTANITSAAAVGTIIVSIFKNGVELARGNQQGAVVAAVGLTVSVEDLPNGTDVYTLRVFQNSGGVSTIDGTAANTFFSGSRC